MIKNLFKRRKKAEPVRPKRKSIWSTHQHDGPQRPPIIPDLKLPEAIRSTMAMDDSLGRPNAPKSGLFAPGVPPALMDWYASQGFIGYAACALMARHWLIDKVCRMPARDAIRQGYELDVGDDELSKKLRATDDRYSVESNMLEMVTTGRAFGVRAVLFDALSTDPLYYEKPFNIDGVMPGCYQGMVQIEAQWMTPELTDSCLDPASHDFMVPKFWRIGSRRFHASHLHFFVPYPVAKSMRPSYNYGGVSVPERIYERVYAAERTANEAPQLAMTKRMLTFQAREGDDLDVVMQNAEHMAEVRDNYGFAIHGEGESIGQVDTALADFDALIMTQYQLVSSGGEVPATRLLGTQPKGFNSTGDYEESVYREGLEAIQSNDLCPMMVRHYSMVAKSKRIDLPKPITIQWAPLDSPTAAEWAAINKTKAETDKLYFDMQAIDGLDVRGRIRADREGDYFGLAEEVDELDETDQGDTQAQAVGGIEAGGDQGQSANIPGSGTGALPGGT